MRWYGFRQKKSSPFNYLCISNAIHFLVFSPQHIPYSIELTQHTDTYVYLRTCQLLYLFVVRMLFIHKSAIYNVTFILVHVFTQYKQLYFRYVCAFLYLSVLCTI